MVRAEREEFKKIFGNASFYDEIVNLLKEVAGSERGKTEEDEG
ncbi:hypothetical protein LA10_04803 [Thermotoga neapolitana LA10]|nr:hypothetical protein LA10_04803 [Thermotoga neapolitana LA10]